MTNNRCQWNEKAIFVACILYVVFSSLSLHVVGRFNWLLFAISTEIGIIFACYPSLSNYISNRSLLPVRLSLSILCSPVLSPLPRVSFLSSHQNWWCQLSCMAHHMQISTIRNESKNKTTTTTTIAIVVIFLRSKSECATFVNCF